MSSKHTVSARGFLECKSLYDELKKWIKFFEYAWNENSILLPKLFCPSVRKKCSSDRENLLKFKTKGREFAIFLRSVEQFIQTVKGQSNFW